jgi:hypothetical protein
VAEAADTSGLPAAAAVAEAEADAVDAGTSNGHVGTPDAARSGAGTD